MEKKDDKAYHKDHAVHNNKALKYLDKSPDFLDWVLTMCFYTALHAIKHKAFPMESPTSDGGTETIKHFEHYCNKFYGNTRDAHSKLSDLVNSYHDDISAEYSQLKDLCWTARYYDYNCDRDMSNLAKRYKDKIFDYCIE